MKSKEKTKGRLLKGSGKMTDRGLYEKLLKQQEDFQTIFDSMPAIIWYTDRKHRVLRANKTASRVMRLPLEALIGKTIHELFPGRDADKYCADNEEVMAAGRPKLGIIERYQTPKGEAKWAQTDKIPFRDESGNIVGVIIFVLDITEQKRAEEELRMKAQLLDSATDSIIVHDRDGNFLYFNEAACRSRGYTREEMMRMKLKDLIPPESAKITQSHIQEILEKGEAAFEAVNIRKDRSHIPVEIRARLIESGNQKLILSVARDLSERKRLEAQLLQAQRLDAIGRLAAGVAHDFNNILTVIQGRAQLALMKVDEADPLSLSIRQIIQAAESAANLTRQLLLFSRKQPMEFIPIDLNKTIDRMLKMLGRTIGEDIRIHTALEPELRSISADEGNIEQVIMNMAINAKDAMPHGGTLTLTTENVRLSEVGTGDIPGSKPGKYVCLTLSDTGAGMAQEILQHIFEPFFTTKETGRGSGLGLSVVYGIVQFHKGWIRVESEPGKGSAFKMYFPAISAKPPETTGVKMSLSGLRGKGERILLAEDAEEVRRFARSTLQEAGYRVFDASGMEEAAEIFEKENGNFDLVFSDVIMPGGSGLELIDRLLLRKPGLRVLMTSGYMDDKSQWPLIHERGFRFLQKPYTVLDLLQTVKELLKGQGEEQGWDRA